MKQPFGTGQPSKCDTAHAHHHSALGPITFATPDAWVLLGGGGGSGDGKLVKPAHQKALEKSLGIRDHSCLILRLSHTAMWWRI